MRTGLAKGLKRRYGFGFKPKFSLTAEEKFLMRLDFKGKTVFDVGGYVGIHTLFFARATGEKGRVVTFEPNPRNYEELVYNVRLNGFDNVTTMQIGLGRRYEWVYMVVDPMYPARGTLNRKERRIRRGRKRAVKVELFPLDSLMEKGILPKPDFIKVDVEGFEMDVLYAMVGTINNYKPGLFIEIHENSEKLIGFLFSKGYSIYHVESHIEISPQNFSLIRGHIYGSFQ